MAGQLNFKKMNTSIIYILLALIALIAGVFLGKIIFAKNTREKIEEAEKEARRIVEEAELKNETIKKEKILEAKEKYVQLKADFDKDTMERNRKISEAENRIKQKKLVLTKRIIPLKSNCRKMRLLRKT